MLQELEKFSKLEENWDGWGADPPNELALLNTQKIINLGYLHGLQPNTIDADVLGGMGIVYHNDKRNVWICLLNNGAISIISTNEVGLTKSKSFTCLDMFRIEEFLK